MGGEFETVDALLRQPAAGILDGVLRTTLV